MFEPQPHSGVMPPTAEQMKARALQLQAAAINITAVRMLLQLQLEPAEQIETLRRWLERSEIGVRLAPTLHSKSIFKWCLVTPANELVLELGEGSLS